jgi:glycosyltransferase involved in cell wall biosynthesis
MTTRMSGSWSFPPPTARSSKATCIPAAWIDRKRAPVFQNVMDWKRQCAAVVPCYNEAAHIGTVIAGIQRHLPKVIVVDDGSTDATAEKAKMAGAEVVHRPTNCGKGAALRAGWKRAGELGFAWALMLDGDGQHATDDIPDFFACAEKKQIPLIVGNRMGNSRAMPWLRRKANLWMSKRLSRLTGVQLPDSQCGFRLAHLEILLQLPLRANRFEIESEMLVAFLTAKQRVEFVPTQVIYKSNASRINPLTDTWRWLRWRLAQGGVFRACNTVRVP